MQPLDPSPGEDVSPDRKERIEDFLARHGGPGRPGRGEATEPGVRGWNEVYAADGYTLRCAWSRFGGNERMEFSEIAPTAAR